MQASPKGPAHALQFSMHASDAVTLGQDEECVWKEAIASLFLIDEVGMQAA